MPETLVSHHIFLFPFEWRFKESKLATMEEKTNLTPLLRQMSTSGKRWERRSSWLKPSSILQYNEANYFYDFVRPVLYDTGRKESLLCHYYHKIPDGAEYVIELSDGTTYRLDLEDIVLSFYNTGVGVMAFHLWNKREEQAKSEDILKINQFGRRLYPPFLGSDTGLLGGQAFFEDARWSKGLQGVQQFELAASIRLEVGKKPWITEDFVDWQISAQLDREPGLIRALLPKALLQEVRLSPVLDDRMFVVCWYGNDSQIAAMQLGKAEQLYKSNDWWYQFVFVDGGYKSCQNDEMTQELLVRHTNARWANDGTFYGVSRYSLVCLTQSMESSDFARVLCSHVQTMYYKIASLALVQRACVMRFSEEITAISQLSEKDRKVGKKVSSLYRQYLRFINKIYFREVTAQEQGIELYDLLHEHMRLETHTRELEVEVQELHNYVSLVEQEQRNDKLDLLTYIGAFLLGPSFIASFLGIDPNLLKNDAVGLGLFCVALALLSFFMIKASNRWRLLWLAFLIVVILWFLFVYVNVSYS